MIIKIFLNNLKTTVLLVSDEFYLDYLSLLKIIIPTFIKAASLHPGNLLIIKDKKFIISIFDE